MVPKSVDTEKGYVALTSRSRILLQSAEEEDEYITSTHRSSGEIINSTH